MKMDAGRWWLLKNPAVFKNVINLPSSFSLRGQLGKSQGWAVFTVGVCVSKTHFSICIKFPSVSCCYQIRPYLGRLLEGLHFKCLPCFPAKQSTANCFAYWVLLIHTLTLLMNLKVPIAISHPVTILQR